MNTHTVDGLEVVYIPNAFSNDVLRKWEDFYRTVPFFNCGGNTKADANHYFTAGLNLVDYINIFPVSDVIEHARLISPDCKKSSYQKSYINAIRSNQTFEPHKDRYELGENEFYTIALWFGNPHWDHVSGGSLVLGDQQDFNIPNRYNDLVIFPGQLLHSMESHTSNLARVTVYSAFTNQFNNLAGEINQTNVW
jgi:hypothetical protein|tara:strand:+ start:234 stop:815 length:582 start_codon:yes stop_codon:yes gene_type:complete